MRILLEKLPPHPPPLRQEADGTLRVGDSQVSLDTVIKAFQVGASLEAIVDRYPSLSLTDVYAAVTYYLWNADIVEAYLSEQQSRGMEIRATMEARLIQETQVASQPDASVLEWAAQPGRFLLTHDINTLLICAYDRIERNVPMTGVAALA